MVDNNKILDINALLNNEVREVSFNVEIDLCADGVAFTRPATMNGKAVNMASYIEFTSSIDYFYSTACSRCLKQLQRNLHLELKFPVAVSLENDDEADEYIIPQNGKINLQEICEENFILNLPIRELCSEDCKGLCPRCGADLNVSGCSCPKKDVDIRLQGLADFFKD
ncbi:MAG: DUF177 domain-containing protein [Clostridia bacterium]|nr:DUF177 domain-containing protein [Clostridia bacterium]